MRIKIPDKLSYQFYKREGEIITVVIDGYRYTGKLVVEHPNFDPALVRNEHYYGDIDYYVDVPIDPLTAL